MTWEIIAGIIALCGFIVTVVKTVVPLTNATGEDYTFEKSIWYWKNYNEL